MSGGEGLESPSDLLSRCRCFSAAEDELSGPLEPHERLLFQRPSACSGNVPDIPQTPLSSDGTQASVAGPADHRMIHMCHICFQAWKVIKMNENIKGDSVHPKLFQTAFL